MIPPIPFDISYTEFSVKTLDDGSVEVYARIVAPDVHDFNVRGDEAVKRYNKFILWSAAGMLQHMIPGIADVVQRMTDIMGPDSDD